MVPRTLHSCSADGAARTNAGHSRFAPRALKLTLKTRLILLACVPLLALLIGGAAALHRLRATNEVMGSIYRDRVVPLRQIKLVADAFAVDLVDQTHKVRDGTVSWESARRTLVQTQQTARKHWRDYLATYLVDEERRQIAVVVPRLEHAQRLSRTLDEILARQDRDALQRFAAHDMYPVVDPLSQALNGLTQVQLDESQRLYELSEADYRRVAGLMWAALALVVLCAAAFAWVLSHSTIRSIRRAADAAAAVAKGRISQAIDIDASGETGVLLSAIESIRQQLSCSMEEMVQLLQVVPVPLLTAKAGHDEVRHVNPAFEHYFGLSQERAIGRRLEDLPIWHDAAAIEAWRRCRQAMETSAEWVKRADLMLLPGRGEPACCEVTTLVHRRESPPSMLVVFEDVTTRRAQEHALRDRACRDALTRLPNRAAIEQDLANAWVAWQLRRQPFAVAMVDLDGFKPINDRFGHAVGDAVLVETARRLLMVNRTTSDVCGRWGGDEFVLIFNGCANLEQAMAAAQRTLESIRSPLDIDALTCSVGASIGVAHTASDPGDVLELLRQADQWMYAAKASGRNRVMSAAIDGNTTT